MKALNLKFLLKSDACDVRELDDPKGRSIERNLAELIIHALKLFLFPKSQCTSALINWVGLGLIL